MNKTTKDVQHQNSDFSPLSFSVGLDNNFLDLLSFEAIVFYQQTTNMILNLDDCSYILNT